MNDDPRDSDPDNPMDRDLMDYLDEILHDPTVARSAAVPLIAPDNVASFDASRIRKPEPSVAKVKQEPAQAVTLPFRPAEKPRVLMSPSLLKPKPATTETPATETTATKDVSPEVTVEPVQPIVPAAKAPPPPVPPTPETPKVPDHPVTPEPDSVSPVAPSLEAVEVADESIESARLPEVREWNDNGRPEWAQSRFECLIFNVAGLRLAVPLITLGAIHQIDRKFNALPHQSEWFLGILQTASAGNIKVLDTALCVMPERYDPASREGLAYVITIHGYNWGLACHSVEQSITLEPDQVKWRTHRGKRPWLAGTVIDQMCALIDTDGFHDVILRAEQSR